MKIKSAGLTLAAAAAIAFAPLAQADPNAASNNDQYDQYMISHGMNDPAMDGVGLLAHGQQACQALRGGQSEASLTNQLESQVSIAEAQNIVYAAHRYLCPGA
jgi:uncharacterized protein DUF732